jgi:transcription antitermination factor NusA-like protein
VSGGVKPGVVVLVDPFQLKKELEELTARVGQQTVQEIKEGSLSESSCKEEENSADKSAVQVKDEVGACASKDGAEEEAEVSTLVTTVIVLFLLTQAVCSGCLLEMLLMCR